MKRTITITIIALAVVAFFWASASAGYIEDTTLNEINGPKISKTWRNGVLTGVFLTVMSSEAVSCQMMSAHMMIAGIDSLLAAGEITGDWTVYKASLYALARAGCTATKKEQTNA
jgi:hypothetical protein